MSAMLRIIVLLPLLVFFISPDKGMSQTSEGGQAIEVWPEFTVNYDPSKKVRLMFAIRNERNEDTPDKTVETTATVIYRLRPLVRNMLFADDEADNEKKYALSLAANWEYSRSFGKTHSRLYVPASRNIGTSESRFRTCSTGWCVLVKIWNEIAALGTGSGVATSILSLIGLPYCCSSPGPLVFNSTRVISGCLPPAGFS